MPPIRIALLPISDQPNTITEIVLHSFLQVGISPLDKVLQTWGIPASLLSESLVPGGDS